MRALALLGLLTTACGLEMGGLGAEPASEQPVPDMTSTDAARHQPASDASRMDETLLARSDATASSESGSSSAAGGNGDARASMDDGGGDADAIRGGDAGGQSDAGAFRDTGAGDATRNGGSGNDASASVDGAAADAGTACTSTIPVGWTLEVYDLGLGPCPANFTAHDAYGPPTIGAGACACPCGVTQAGDCLQGMLTVYGTQDNSNACTTPLFSLDATGGACLSVGQNASAVTVTAQTQASAVPAKGGACSGTSRVDPTQVSTPAALYCDVPASSAESVCNGTVPSGFAACIAKSGVLPCAAGTPFVHRYVVEDGATLQCSPCGACSAATTCSNATIAAYDNRQCFAPAVASIRADGMCGLSAGRGAFPVDALSVMYSATAVTTCTEGSSTAGVQLANPRTICCL